MMSDPPDKNAVKSNRDLPIYNDRLKQNFILFDEIGHGAFGKVYKVRHRLISKDYALKTVETKTVDEVFKNMREFTVWTKLQSKWIVQYRTHWFEMNPANLITINILMGLCAHNLRLLT